MVSSVLGVTVDELVATLERFTLEYSSDPEFVDRRSAVPVEFPF